MKNQLRKKYLALRNSLGADVSEQIQRKLISLPEYRQAEAVFCYLSFGSEIKTDLIVRDALSSGKILTVPKCIENGIMNAVRITSLDDLRPGKYGIPEPADDLSFDKQKISLAVVPAVCFDRNGYRLGYGGGYYDRFLSDISPLKIGLCRRELIADSLPHDEFDIRVDFVISD